MGLARFGGHGFQVRLTVPGCARGCSSASDKNQGERKAGKMEPHGHTSLSYWTIRDSVRKGSWGWRCLRVLERPILVLRAREDGGETEDGPPESRATDTEHGARACCRRPALFGQH